jgi:hypothetical protein
MISSGPAAFQMTPYLEIICARRAEEGRLRTDDSLMNFEFHALTDDGKVGGFA